MVDTTNLSLKHIQTLAAHKEKVWCVAWNPNGDILASCSGDKTIKIWGKGLNAGLECKATLTEQHTRTIRAVTWSPDGQLLASVGFDSQLCLWLMKSDKFECVATMEGHENEIKAVAWDSTMQYMATCGRDKTVWIWDRDEGYEWSCYKSLTFLRAQDVKHLKWLPDSQILASCGYDDMIKFWQYEDDEWNCITTLTGHNSTVWCIDFNSEGKYMVSCSDDQTIKIWEKNMTNTKSLYSLISTLNGYHDRAIYSCSWNFNGNYIATVKTLMEQLKGGGDDRICIFLKKIVNGESLPSFENVEIKENAHHSDVNCVVFHPTDNYIASCGDDGIINIWSFNQASDISIC